MLDLDLDRLLTSGGAGGGEHVVEIILRFLKQVWKYRQPQDFGQPKQGSLNTVLDVFTISQDTGHLEARG